MTDYLEKALMAEKTENETGAEWAESLSGNESLLLQGARRERRANGGEAVQEAQGQDAPSLETGRTQTNGTASDADALEIRAKAETESVAALSWRLSEAERMARAVGTAAAQRKWEESAGSSEMYGSLARGERSGDMLRSAEKFDRLVERDARRYGGTFSLF